VGEPLRLRRFEFPEAVEVELADEALELGVPEVERKDILLEFMAVQHLNDCVFVGPAEDGAVGRILSEMHWTWRR
jgi:hypothetical protein